MLRADRFVALIFAFALAAAACGSGDGGSEASAGGVDEVTGGSDGAVAVTAGEIDLEGVEINILGPEVNQNADSFIAGFDPLVERTGVVINYNGTRDASTELNIALEAGAPPDLVMIPQPGRTQVFAAEGDAVPISQDVLDASFDNFDPFWWELASVDEVAYGVPVKGDLKSLVWYSPSNFEANGYSVPETFAELEELVEQIKADGDVPWCVGIESGDATGWALTDWMEDFMLRIHGPEVYDQWVNHEIPFDDPKVAEVAEFVADIWFTEGNALGDRDTIATTQFSAAGLPVPEGDCYLHRQANFYASNFKDAGYTVGPGQDVDVFYLPTIDDDFGTVVLGAGYHAVAFNDSPEVMAVLGFMASPEYPNARISSGKGGFLSPNINHDQALYPDDLDRNLAEILVSADPFRFDGSDLMPGEVGAGEFWRSGTDWVSGLIELDEFLSNVEESWTA